MSKSTSQRNERILTELRAREGNDECADCGARQPRWASWNLGIWLCVKCATIHRRMGTHISRVKSLSLDIWTKEQVESMRDNGNIKSNQLYNPNPRLNPPPLDLESEHSESQLERFIFQKYRDRAFMEKPKKKSASRLEAVPVPTPSPSDASRLPIAVATKNNGSTQYTENDESRSNKARTPAVSITSPQDAERRAFSPPAMPYAAQPTSSHLSAATNPAAGRAMTAPLPDISTRSFSPSVSSGQNYNPFHRQMTASAQIPSVTGTSSQMPSMGYSTGSTTYNPVNNNNASYLQSNLSSSYAQAPMYKQAIMPQSQTTNSKGEVWQDLAGLSLSNNSMSLHQPMSNTFTGYQPSSMSSMQTTNPFLQSSSMFPKPPSQISSMSSGSSFSSLGSTSSTGFSPGVQIPNYQTSSNIPAYQHQTQQFSTPVAGNPTMAYMGMQQPQQPMIQPQQKHQQTYQFHASNPYASQYTQMNGQQQQPAYSQFVQYQYQGM